MRAPPDVEDLRQWAVVAAMVRPLRPSHPQAVIAAAAQSPKSDAPRAVAAHPRPTPPRPPLPTRRNEAPRDLEAGLRRRLTRGHEALAARIDLHGLTHDAARAALTGFVRRSAAEGWRAVLVITGKGARGDGMLRRRVPDWLAEAPIREHVAGVSEAHRRHGGEGALYVALKR